jgi:hypothetical protein
VVSNEPGLLLAGSHLASSWLAKDAVQAGRALSCSRSHQVARARGCCATCVMLPPVSSSPEQHVDPEGSPWSSALTPAAAAKASRSLCSVMSVCARRFRPLLKREEKASFKYLTQSLTCRIFRLKFAIDKRNFTQLFILI